MQHRRLLRTTRIATACSRPMTAMTQTQHRRVADDADCDGAYADTVTIQTSTSATSPTMATRRRAHDR